MRNNCLLHFCKCYIDTNVKLNIDIYKLFELKAKRQFHVFSCSRIDKSDVVLRHSVPHSFKPIHTFSGGT